jgi:hypothetical protein
LKCGWKHFSRVSTASTAFQPRQEISDELSSLYLLWIINKWNPQPVPRPTFVEVQLTRQRQKLSVLQEQVPAEQIVWQQGWWMRTFYRLSKQGI